MNRRRFLALLGASGLAGCQAGGDSKTPDGETPTSETATPTQSPAEPVAPTVTERPLAEQGIPSTVCEEAIQPDFYIRAIVEPATDDSWAGYEIGDDYETDGTGRLPEESIVVGLAGDDRVRAYPFDVIYQHEIVNDTIDGPVLVTFCSLCQSGMVARRTVAGEETTFEVSGLLWQPPRVRVENSQLQNRTTGISRSETGADVRTEGNLVMYDHATRSYWSQILARAICGPQQGTRLEILPSTVTTWGEWQSQHPETDVLLPPPHSTTA